MTKLRDWSLVQIQVGPFIIHTLAPSAHAASGYSLLALTEDAHCSCRPDLLEQCAYSCAVAGRLAGSYPQGRTRCCRTRNPVHRDSPSHRARSVALLRAVPPPPGIEALVRSTIHRAITPLATITAGGS